MKLYFCTQDVTPNEQDYFLNDDMSADMVTPLYHKAQVIDWTTAKRIKELHGKGYTDVVEIPSVFGVVKFIADDGQKFGHQYYMPAL